MAGDGWRWQWIAMNDHEWPQMAGDDQGWPGMAADGQQEIADG